VVFDGLGGYDFQDYARRPASVGPPEFKAAQYEGSKNPGNLFDAMLERLQAGQYSNTDLLTRIDVVQFDGTVLAVFENQSGTWSRKQ
jgi:hypothetical protein